MSKSLIAVFVSVVLAIGLVVSLSRRDVSTASSTTEIRVSCAASNQAVIEEIRAAYEAETGRKVVINYGTSQSLLSQIEVSQIGDLFLPADDSFLKTAKQKEMIDEVFNIAKMQCGIVVKKGNPLAIRDLDSLIHCKGRIVQANPDAAAVAKLTRQVLRESNRWEELEKATAAFRSTVTEVASDVHIGAADVGIVYDAVLYAFPDLEFVSLPELQPAVSQVSIGVLKHSANPTAALHFARYITANDRGLLTYKKHGFQIEAGDRWEEIPELAVYAGSMLRPVIEETIVEFEKREGVQVSRVYNGCGILVAQMKSGQTPDAYFACDVEFMSQVQDLFPVSEIVSQNQLAILVPKGNPHKIESLKDLTKPGLRVGVGHEKQCAMGWITQKTFSESGLQSKIMSNVTVQTPTGDMLVNQLRTGSLDAAVAYLSNAAGSAEFLDAYEIDGIPCSTATQPWGVAKNSQHAQLANRLFGAIRSAESQETFEAEGFHWILGTNQSLSEEAIVVETSEK